MAVVTIPKLHLVKRLIGVNAIGDLFFLFLVLFLFIFIFFPPLRHNTS